MKKQIAMLLCSAALTLGLTTAPATASVGPCSPIEVETYTYGPFDEPRVNKVYRLSVADDPSGIPTEDFERGGRRYYLLDMIADSTDHETVTYTAVFGSVELAKATSLQALDGTDDSLGVLLVLSCMGGVIMAAATAIYVFKAKTKKEDQHEQKIFPRARPPPAAGGHHHRPDGEGPAFGAAGRADGDVGRTPGQHRPCGGRSEDCPAI